MSIIDRTSKFAQAAQRIVEITGEAYHYATTYGDEIRDAGAYENAIAESLRASGWGVYSFQLIPRRSYVQQTYDFVARIETSLGDNPERIRQAVFNVVSHYIPNVSATVSNDYVLQPSGGGFQAVPTVNTSLLPQPIVAPSLWEQLFGEKTNALDAGGKVLGLSVSTLVVAGIVYFVATSRKRR